MKEAVILLAPGFEECEALCVNDILVRGGVNTVLVGVGEKIVESSHCVKVAADEVLSEKTLEKKWDLVFLPGGMPGAGNLFSSPLVRKLVTKANENLSLMGAICASPAVVLGSMHLLDGRKATVFPGCESYSPQYSFSSDGVVVSGNIVTGKSLGYALDMGITLLSLLTGKENADRVKEQIYYKEGMEL